MKPKAALHIFAAGTASVMLLAPATVQAVALTWDGGGTDNNWSTDANWVGDPLLNPTNGDTLTFAGSTRLTSNNDLTGLILANATNATAFTFSSGAGAFVLSGSSITTGTTGGNTNVVYQQSASNVEIQNNLTFAGNQRDRNIGFTASTGTVTLSGNVNFSNDIIGLGRNSGAATSAGTLVLSGNNTGDGKGAQISAGGNQMRAMLWTGVAGNRVVIGSDTALGNAGSGSADAGTAVFKGILAGQQLYISTANGARNLSNSTFGITNRIDFDGADNLTIGNVINSGGNRDLHVTGAGALTVANGLFLSNNSTGRNLYFNVTGAGGAVVNGKIYDTFENTSGTYVTMASQGTLRKAGAGALTLNGDSNYKNLTYVEGGTLKLGHANALGSSASSDYTSIRGGTLDLNGVSIAEKIWSDTGTNILANSNADTAAVTTDIGLSNNLTVNTTGNITAERLVAGAIRTVTKLGAGTFTTQGAGTNNLTSWDIQAGTVVFANTTGLASDRGTNLNGGTLRLSGSNSNLINDGQAFTINSGTFDLNGKGEAVASIGGSGGTVTNSAASTTSTLFVGGGSGGSSSATFGGVIENGAGTMNVTKEGTGTQTLTGTQTYTGSTTVANGSLVINGNISTSTLTTVQNGATLGGSGNVGSLTVLGGGTLAPGNSPGTLGSGTLTLNDTSILSFELDPADLTIGLGINDLVSVTGNLTLDGLLDVVPTSGDFLSANIGQSWRLLNYSGSLTNQNLSLRSMPSLGSGLSWGIDTNTTGQVNLVVVPEPAAALLGSIGLLVLLRRRRG